MSFPGEALRNSYEQSWQFNETLSKSPALIGIASIAKSPKFAKIRNCHGLVWGCPVSAEEGAGTISDCCSVDFEVEPLRKQAIHVLETILDAEHLDLAEKLSNLADDYHTSGKLTEAEALYWIVLAMREKALGEEHRDVAMSLLGLSSVYESLGRYYYAETFAKQALVILERVLGPDHPDVAINLHTLASNYISQGKLAEAEPLHRRMLEMWENILGLSHPLIAPRLERYAQLLRSIGKIDEASRMESRAQSLRNRVRV